jgi:hypothetical protein
MKKYKVEIPITGFISVEVEACNKQDAIKKAFEYDDLTVSNIENWELHEKIVEGVEGTVFHGLLNEIEVEEI